MQQGRTLYVLKELGAWETLEIVKRYAEVVLASEGLCGVGSFQFGRNVNIDTAQRRSDQDRRSSFRFGSILLKNSGSRELQILANTLSDPENALNRPRSARVRPCVATLSV